MTLELAEMICQLGTWEPVELNTQKNGFFHDLMFFETVHEQGMGNGNK